MNELYFMVYQHVMGYFKSEDILNCKTIFRASKRYINSFENDNHFSRYKFYNFAIAEEWR